MNIYVYMFFVFVIMCLIHIYIYRNIWSDHPPMMYLPFPCIKQHWKKVFCSMCISIYTHSPANEPGTHTRGPIPKGDPSRNVGFWRRPLICTSMRVLRWLGWFKEHVLRTVLYLVRRSPYSINQHNLGHGLIREAFPSFKHLTQFFFLRKVRGSTLITAGLFTARSMVSVCATVMKAKAHGADVRETGDVR